MTEEQRKQLEELGQAIPAKEAELAALYARRDVIVHDREVLKEQIAEAERAGRWAEAASLKVQLAKASR